MQILIQVCVKCGYWPINGEEHDHACKQCGNSEKPESSKMPTHPATIGRYLPPVYTY